jgi:ribonuclease HI
MYQLKAEFKQYYEANKKAIKEAEQIFFANDSKYLKETLTAKWKKSIDSLWYKSPLSKIQDGFKYEAVLTNIEIMVKP